MSRRVRTVVAMRLLRLAKMIVAEDKELIGKNKEKKSASIVLAGEDDMCGKKGCIRKVGDSWRIMSGKTGKYWPQHYKDKATAQKVLKRYHGWGF